MPVPAQLLVAERALDAHRQRRVGRGDLPRGDLPEHERQLGLVEQDDVDAAGVRGVVDRPDPHAARADRPGGEVGEDAVEVASLGPPAGAGGAVVPSVGVSVPSPIAAAIADHTASAAGYWSAAGTDGSRAVSTAAASAASSVCAPASATTSPSASVTSAGRSTSSGPRPSSSSASRSASTTSTSSSARPSSASASAGQRLGAVQGHRLGDRQPLVALAAAGIGAHRHRDHAPAGARRLDHEHGHRGQLPAVVDDGEEAGRRRREHQLRAAGRGVGALRRVVQRHRPEHAEPDGGGRDGDGRTGGDEGRAAATAGEGRHPSLPYRPRSSMTCSTGSVTR